MTDYKSIIRLDIEELSAELGEEIMNRRATKSALKKVDEANDMFWGFDNRFFKIDPLVSPELDFYEGESYYVAINYKFVPGNGSRMSEYDAYTAGILKKTYGKNFAYLDFIADDKENGYFLESGVLQHGKDSVHFGHASQLLEKYRNVYGLTSTSEEGLYDELIDKVVPRELTALFFKANIDYAAYTTPKEWTYSLTNSFYFAGEEYNYWDLENMSREFIVNNYSNYVYLDDTSDAHHVFSRMTDYLLSHGFIEDAQKRGNVLAGVSINRLNTIKWLGITPLNKKPTAKTVNTAVVQQVNLCEGDKVQIDINCIVDIVLSQHKTAVKYDADWLELDVDEIFEDSLKGEVIEVSKSTILLDTEAGRVRVDASLLTKDGNIVYSEEDKNLIKQKAAEAIEEFDRHRQTTA